MKYIIYSRPSTLCRAFLVMTTRAPLYASKDTKSNPFWNHQHHWCINSQDGLVIPMTSSIAVLPWIAFPHVDLCLYLNSTCFCIVYMFCVYHVNVQVQTIHIQFCSALSLLLNDSLRLVRTLGHTLWMGGPVCSSWVWISRGTSLGLKLMKRLLSRVLPFKICFWS